MPWWTFGMTLSILTERGHQANICIRSVLKLSIPKRSGARWKNSNIDLETHFLPETSFYSHLKMSRPWGVPPGAAKDTWLIHIHAIPIRSCPPADHSKPCICTVFALLGDNSEQFSALIELNSKQALVEYFAIGFSTLMNSPPQKCVLWALNNPLQRVANY